MSRNTLAPMIASPVTIPMYRETGLPSIAVVVLMSMVGFLLGRITGGEIEPPSAIRRPAATGG
jgi:hypothetical protein